jgi:hypothetical protein
MLAVRIPMFISDCSVRELAKLLVSLHLVIDVEFAVQVLELLLAQGRVAHEIRNDLILLLTGKIAHFTFRFSRFASSMSRFASAPSSVLFFAPGVRPWIHFSY